MLRCFKASGCFDALKCQQILIILAIHLCSFLYSSSAPASPPSSPSLPPAIPLSLLPHPLPSAIAFSSFMVVIANPTSFLLRDAVARSSANFVAAFVSLSLSPSSSLPSPMTSEALWPSHFSIAIGLISVFINPPVPPSQLAIAAIDLDLASSFFFFSFLMHRGRATGAFFPYFLTASSPPSPLRPRPASSIASFSFDVIPCCHHGLEVAVSLHWSLLCMRTLPPSLPSSPPSLVPSWGPMAKEEEGRLK